MRPETPEGISHVTCATHSLTKRTASPPPAPPAPPASPPLTQNVAREGGSEEERGREGEEVGSVGERSMPVEPSGGDGSAAAAVLGRTVSVTDRGVCGSSAADTDTLCSGDTAQAGEL